MHRSLLAAVAVGYILLVGAIWFGFDPPWNWAVSGIILMKGLTFLFIMRRAAQIGERKRPPTP